MQRCYSTRAACRALPAATSRPHRRAPAWVLGLAALALLARLSHPGPTAAQGTSGPGLGTLVLDWARGQYATPLLCEIDGQPVRGTRRVLITPTLGRPGRPADRIIFVDLEPGAAARCFDDFGEPEPNIVGILEIQYLATYHPETARRDFKDLLRRKRSFEFAITSGHLRVQEVRQPPAASETVDFARGRASLRVIEPGTDPHRLLADFQSPRKLLLELETPDGRQLRFPLFLRDLR